MVTIGVVASVFLAALLVLLSILGSRLTAQTLVTAALVAIIPLLVIVPTFLWLDRFEAEPARYLVFAFLWGALVAVVGAFFLNTVGLRLLIESRWTDPLETGAVYVAPVTEETLKGLGILLVYLLRRREFDGIIDGIVYGGLIGAGFAFSENILYLGQAYNLYGDEGLTATFVVRCLMGPFGHPLFTALTGIGIGIAVSSRKGGRARRGGARRLGLRDAAPQPVELLGPRRHRRLLRGLPHLPGAALPRLHRLPRVDPSP